MKNLKTFENFEEAPKNGKVTALCTLWKFDPKIISDVFYGLGGQSFDEADEYLDLMDSEGTNDPAEVWEAWQEMHDIGHEPNPFLNGKVEIESE